MPYRNMMDQRERMRCQCSSAFVASGRKPGSVSIIEAVSSFKNRKFVHRFLHRVCIYFQHRYLDKGARRTWEKLCSCFPSTNTSTLNGS